MWSDSTHHFFRNHSNISLYFILYRWKKKLYKKKIPVHIIIKLHRTYIQIYNVISDIYPLYRHLQENVLVSIYISKIVLVMIEYKIKTILKCNKADPDGIPLPKGGGRVVVSHTTLNNISAILCHSILLV